MTKRSGFARQGIYNRNNELFAFELLYRYAGKSPQFQLGDKETSWIIKKIIENPNIDTLIDGKKAFINFTYNHLVQHVPLLLSKDKIVIEVLESTPINNTMIQSLQLFKKKGYTIALDDFVYHPHTEYLLELADIIKIDVLKQEEPQIEAQLRLLHNYEGALLAEKVETRIQYETCFALGFNYFQGFYLHKPDLLSIT